MPFIVVASQAPDVTADLVPGVYDVIINGKGYVFADIVDQNVAFRVRKAAYSYSRTFVERQNTHGDYGDNQQDFFSTASQKDFSLGEGLRYARPNDAELARRYYKGTNVDVTSIPGQATLRYQTTSIAVGASVRATAPRGIGSSANIMAAGTSNLYEISPAGTVTNRGAHGLGAAPSRTGIATDGSMVYFTTSAGGSVGVRKWDGASFTTFSASFADSLEYLNNTLFGFKSNTAELVRWDTSGVLSSPALFPWRNADGGTRKGNFARLRAYGGDLLCLWSDGPGGAELWIYDGSATRMLQTFPNNFYAADMCVQLGTVYISGSYVRSHQGSASNLITKPAVLFYANGQLGKAWEADTEMTTSVSNVATANNPAICPFATGVIFNDDTRGALMYYAVDLGGASTIGTYTVAGDTPLLCSSQEFLLHTRDQATAYFYPDTTSIASSGTVTTALIDFDSSLIKYFRGVKVDAFLPNGCTVGLAYSLDRLDQTYTNLSSTVTPGTEYTINDSGHSVSIQATLNSSGSATPILKRISVRGVPVATRFRLRTYIFNLSGRDGESPTILRNGTYEPRTAMEMANDISEAVTATTPITITDRFGTFTGVIEPDDFEFAETHPGEFIAHVPVREV